MCGIIGLVYANPEKHVYQGIVDALTLLQHRGQDAAGIVTVNRNKLNLRKDTGTVADVFQQSHASTLLGNIGCGHVRYPTAGDSSCSAEAQPLYTNTPFGIALAHNGNLTNTNELLKRMQNERRHINTNNDSELLLNLFAEELSRKRDIGPDELFDCVRSVMRRCKGGYAVVMIINRVGLLAFRDPNGIRPLCFGSRVNDFGTDYAVASESVAVDALDSQFKLERDLAPSEAIYISMEGLFYSHVAFPQAQLTPCIFEYVYFARPDSVLDGVLVYEARSKMGESLARKIQSLLPALEIDTVIPIPETSRTAALSCATALLKPYREGFVKNRYIARTFLMPGQDMRQKTVRLKLNTIKREFKDKNVLLVDDSIVRGTTSKEICEMAREAGAKRIYFASAAPPVRYSNVYGIDIPTRSELIAHNRSEEEIAREIGADKVIYNDLEDIAQAIQSLNPTVLKTFDMSCFDGHYVTEVTQEYLETLENTRGRNRKGAAAVTENDSVFSLDSPGTNRTFSPSPPVETNQQSLNSSSSIRKSTSRVGFETTNRESPGVCESIHNSL